jgi:tripartite-type tricarboxylate transporter receptor subunit TctC
MTPCTCTLRRWSAAALCAASLVVHAQTFPARQITLIVPYPAGGASDFVARVIQPEYERQFAQTVIVENVGGASGAIGVQRTLDALADGHTQLLATPMELVLAPLSLPAIRFKPEDVRLVGLIASTSILLVVRSDLPARTIDELLDWAAGRSLAFGNVGVGSQYHLMADRLATMAGLQVTHVPYKGVGPLLNDLAGKQIDAAFLPLAGPIPGMVRDGKVTAIGVSSPGLHPMFPDVAPISRHRLLSDFNFDIWIGVQVPAGIPEHAATRINAAVNHVIRQAEVRKGLADTGATVAPPMTLLELDALFKTEVARYRSMARSMTSR